MSDVWKPSGNPEQVTGALNAEDIIARLNEDARLEDDGPMTRFTHVDQETGQKEFVPNIIVPGYEILDELGRGGMGVVYKARQVKLNRLVALKMILSGEAASEQQLQRFRAEAEAIAKVQHPNIVQVYEVGEILGQPYFALEYIDGGTLADKIDGRPQTARASAALVETLARAVQAAHEQGVVHRDLKPSNILLAGLHNAATSATRSGRVSAGSAVRLGEFGEPKITDFGLAKRLDSTDNQTRTGSVLGTPAYMAPEQADGRIREIGPATDVYALGAILYEMLTGRPPFQAETSMEVVLRVLQDEVVAPRSLQPRTPLDLDTITTKCLHKDPSRRYASAEELADDLRRFLDGEAIAARRASPYERVRQWTRRHPAAATGLGVALVSAVTLTLFGIWSYVKLSQAFAEAQSQKAEAFRQLVRVTVASGGRSLDEGDLPAALPWFSRALLLERGNPEREEMHRIRLHAVLAKCRRLTNVSWHDGPVTDVEFAPDGRYFTSGLDGIVRVWGGEKPIEWKLPAGVKSVHFAAKGPRLLIACDDGQVRVGESMESCLAFAVPTLSWANFLADDTQILTGGSDGFVRVWDTATGKPIGEPIAHGSAIVNGSVCANRNSEAALVCADGTVVVWRFGTKPETVIPPLAHPASVQHVRFSPDGKRLFTACADGVGRVWTLEAAQIRPVEFRHQGRVNHGSFSPDSQRIASAGEDGMARVWDVHTGLALTPQMRHEASVLRATFSPDGERVATASEENLVRLWDATTASPVAPPLHHNGTVTQADFDSTGRFVLSSSNDGSACLWDLARGCTATAPTPRSRSGRIAYSPDGRKQAIANGHKVTLVNVANEKPIGTEMVHDGEVGFVAFSPDAKRIVTATASGAAHIWSVRDQSAVGLPMKHGSEVLWAAFSPDGARVATASNDNTARIWSVDGKPMTPPMRHPSTVLRCAFGPNSFELVTMSTDGLARAWDAATGDPLAPPALPSNKVAAALARLDDTGWNLLPDSRSLEVLCDLSCWLSSARVDETGGLSALPKSELMAIEARLRKADPALFEVAARDLSSWHLSEAQAAAAKGRWYASWFHESRYLQEFPEDGPARLRRGQALAELGRWSEAAADFAVQTNDDVALANAARAALAAGDSALYGKCCQTLWTRSSRTANGPAATKLIRLCCLSKECGVKPQELAALAKVANPEAVGMAALRSGQPAQAVDQLLDADLDSPTDCYMLALGYRETKRLEDAQRQIKRAKRKCEAQKLTWQQQAELTALEREWDAAKP